MMRIVLMSDIHLEFGALNRPLPDADVLILGGDVTLIGALDRSSDLYHRLPRVRERTLAFIEQCRDTYARIFYLIGNHEAYHYDLTKTPKVIRKVLKGVELLENKAVDLGNDVILAGATLWTDMDQGRDAFVVGRAMNDFRCVYVEDREGARTPGVYQARVFTPQDAMARFKRSKAFIARTAKANPDKTIVVATHHAPSIEGVNPDHTRGASSHINAGYYTDLSAFIAEHRNIRFWCHGHTHIQKRYRIGACQVISNARGYIGQEHSADVFDPDCWFDPVAGKMSRVWGKRAVEEVA